MVDFTTLSIIFILIGAFCTPFIYAHKKKSQQEKQLVQSFLVQAKEHQLHIHVYELWRRTYVIGLDKNLLQLMYIKFHPEMQVKKVDLKKIKTIHIINDHRSVGKDKQIVTDNLWLVLSHEEQSLPDIYLEFFNAAEKDDLLGEPILIQKWHKLLEVTLNDFKGKATEEKKYPVEADRRIAEISDHAIP